jgi:lipopolysaccharide export system permease protein
LSRPYQRIALSRGNVTRCRRRLAPRPQEVERETIGFGVLKIDQYLLRGMVRPFAAILTVLVALFGGFSLAGILSDAVSGLLPIGVIAALAGLKVLIALDVLIPIALFIAVVMAFGRLQADSEMTMMLALGMSPTRLARPVLALALTMSAVVACLSLAIRPLAYAESHAITDRASVMLNVNAMQAGTFYASNDGRQVIFLGGRADRHADGQGVFVARNVAGAVQVIYAHDAQPAVVNASGQRVVHLSDAHIYDLDPLNPANDEVLQAAGMNVNPDSGVAVVPGYSPVAASSLHLAASDRPRDIAELQWRFSTGLSTLLLALLGFVMSRGKPRQNRFASFGPAILAYSGYYLLCTVARTWVEHGMVGRFPGLWWAPAGLALVLATVWFMPQLQRLAARIKNLMPRPPALPLSRTQLPAEPQDVA